MRHEEEVEKRPKGIVQEGGWRVGNGDKMKRAAKVVASISPPPPPLPRARMLQALWCTHTWTERAGTCEFHTLGVGGLGSQDYAAGHAEVPVEPGVPQPSAVRLDADLHGRAAAPLGERLDLATPKRCAEKCGAMTRGARRKMRREGGGSRGEEGDLEGRGIRVSTDDLEPVRLPR